MDSKTRHPIDEAALRIECPHAGCSAGPGQSCRTRSGNKCSQLHSARTEPMGWAYGGGWEDGYRTGLHVGESRGRRAAS